MNKHIRKAVDECASYHRGCIYDHPCEVLAGERCVWFEQAVLPDPNRTQARLAYEVSYVEKSPTESQ